MTVVYTRIASNPHSRQITTELTLDASYPAGGYALDNAQLGLLGTPENVVLTVIHQTATLTLVPMWDPVNNKLKMFKSNTAAAPTEAANTDITTSTKVRVTALGNPIL